MSVAAPRDLHAARDAQDGVEARDGVADDLRLEPSEAVFLIRLDGPYDVIRRGMSDRDSPMGAHPQEKDSKLLGPCQRHIIYRLLISHRDGIGLYPHAAPLPTSRRCWPVPITTMA